MRRFLILAALVAALTLGGTQAASAGTGPARIQAPAAQQIAAQLAGDQVIQAGLATIGLTPAPTGSLVQAFADGVPCGSTLTTAPTPAFPPAPGPSANFRNLVVPASCGAGRFITFTVAGRPVLGGLPFALVGQPYLVLRAY